jgi:hypothetical protein
MNKYIVYSLLLTTTCTLASDGTAPEQTTLNVKSKLPFVDRTQFADRGTIEYTVPRQLDDGIKIGDARKVADLTGILKLLNDTESKNQDFKVGIGEPAKKKSNNPWDPKIKGCIDSILIAKDGKLVLEEYFADARIDKPHYQMSITKSILSYAIGKAIEEGKIKSEKDLLLDYLPELDRTAVIEGVDTLTLHDLLSMNSGIRFKEKPTAKEISIENHAQLYLSQTEPIPEEKAYKYDGTNCDLLTHVLYNTTGQTLTEYVNEHFFAPMGITNFRFEKSVCGLDKAAAGMRLTSRDMLKVGLMTIHNGKWNSKQILNKNWIDKATSVHVNHNNPVQYGYFWWSQNATANGKTYRVRSARGAGGQFIFMVPELDLVAVFTSYYATNKPIEHFANILLPAFLDY